MTAALIIRATEFAIRAHGDQKRDYTGEPYVIHLLAVARTLAENDQPNFVVAGGILHDVLEDTDVTYDQLVREFGTGIADLVREVSEVSKETDGNRAKRKALDRDHYAKAGFHGQTIKVADLMDNSVSIIKYNPKFARVYIPEKRELLSVLTRANHELWARANNMIKEFETQLRRG